VVERVVKILEEDKKGK